MSSSYLKYNESTIIFYFRNLSNIDELGKNPRVLVHSKNRNMFTYEVSMK